MTFALPRPSPPATVSRRGHVHLGAGPIESTTLRGIYEVTDKFDFSTDESIARARP
jgi:hypothetical protein